MPGHEAPSGFAALLGGPLAGEPKLLASRVFLHVQPGAGPGLPTATLPHPRSTTDTALLPPSNLPGIGELLPSASTSPRPKTFSADPPVVPQTAPEVTPLPRRTPLLRPATAEPYATNSAHARTQLSGLSAAATEPPASRAPLPNRRAGARRAVHMQAGSTKRPSAIAPRLAGNETATGIRFATPTTPSAPITVIAPVSMSVSAARPAYSMDARHVTGAAEAGFTDRDKPLSAISAPNVAPSKPGMSLSSVSMPRREIRTRDTIVGEPAGRTASPVGAPARADPFALGPAPAAQSGLRVAATSTAQTPGSLARIGDTTTRIDTSQPVLAFAPLPDPAPATRNQPSQPPSAVPAPPLTSSIITVLPNAPAPATIRTSSAPASSTNALEAFNTVANAPHAAASARPTTGTSRVSGSLAAEKVPATPTTDAQTREEHTTRFPSPGSQAIPAVAYANTSPSAPDAIIAGQPKRDGLRATSLAEQHAGAPVQAPGSIPVVSTHPLTEVIARHSTAVHPVAPHQSSVDADRTDTDVSKSIQTALSADKPLPTHAAAQAASGAPAPVTLAPAPAATPAAATITTVSLEDAPARWVPVLARDLAALGADAPRPARLRLRPDALGMLDVALELRGARVHVALVANSVDAHRLLAAASDDLGQALQTAGLQLDGVSVALGQHHDPQHSPQRSSQDHAPTSSRAAPPGGDAADRSSADRAVDPARSALRRAGEHRGSVNVYA